MPVKNRRDFLSGLFTIAGAGAISTSASPRLSGCLIPVQPVCPRDGFFLAWVRPVASMTDIPPVEERWIARCGCGFETNMPRFVPFQS